MLQFDLVPLFLYKVMILASHMSCVPFLQNLTIMSCRRGNKQDLQCWSMSAGMPAVTAWCFPRSHCSNSFTDFFNSWFVIQVIFVGRLSMMWSASSVTTFRLEYRRENCWIHLPNFSSLLCRIPLEANYRGDVNFLVGSTAFLIQSYTDLVSHKSEWLIYILLYESKLKKT